ncbi:hypothetical protein EGY25_16370 [Brevundimonas intermedia]|uniref:Uncharacterized protein n=1 Tax=Brevundimonas intermedia TaxID=74315 RepID=A0A4Y9RQQ5_9CAUL|nr:hypothetical protein [Brevundimonas intermedia]TFW11232.1 hypothetical protein EGY25_16370 [Brevundimonas intermedia]
MTAYPISCSPMTLAEFVDLATTQGWVLDLSSADDELVLIAASGDTVTAFPQPTTFSEHVGFVGDAGGLVPAWPHGSLECAILEGNDLAYHVTVADVLVSTGNILRNYNSTPPNLTIYLSGLIEEAEKLQESQQVKSLRRHRRAESQRWSSSLSKPWVAS